MTLEKSSSPEWSLVVHKASQTSVDVWAGTLFASLKKPKNEQAKIELLDSKGKLLDSFLIKTKNWKRPFNKLDQRFYTLHSFKNLKAGKHYRLRFSRLIPPLLDQAGYWQQLREGQFDTLPNRIPLSGKKPFTVSLGSCFYNHRDGGDAAASYKALYEHGGNDKPDISFLSGDQVYLDIGFDSLSLIGHEIRQRIAADYALHWQSLGSILNRGANWMLPDDHEYWNDFPNYKTNIPTLQALRLKSVRESWQQCAKNGVDNIQCTSAIDSFSIGNDLSFCVADLRSYRDEQQFTTDALFKQLTTWAEQLTSPGVLVIPQPLMVNKNPTEKNLRSYQQQYQQLLQALASSGHDIVLLSGDVHFGRIGSTAIGNNGARLIEIIASPMSNLTGINGIAVAKPSAKPTRFPDTTTAKNNGWSPQRVEYYHKAFMVETKSGSIFSSYPKTRTKEHFMTIGFSRTDKGKIQLTTKAWSVRERRGKKELPTNGFKGRKKQFKIELK